MVGGHPIICSHRMLEIMFNEPQLLIIYRVALEIEKVYDMLSGLDDPDEQSQFPHLTVAHFIGLQEDVNISTNDPSNNETNDEGMDCSYLIIG